MNLQLITPIQQSTILFDISSIVNEKIPPCNDLYILMQGLPGSAHRSIFRIVGNPKSLLPRLTNHAGPKWEMLRRSIFVCSIEPRARLAQQYKALH
jgi:hypothetical protein